jgi:hypothetical protein
MELFLNSGTPVCEENAKCLLVRDINRKCRKRSLNWRIGLQKSSYSIWSAPNHFGTEGQKVPKGSDVRNIKSSLGPIAKVFTDQEQNELVSYLKLMERLFGLNRKELCGLAYQLAKRNNKLH